MVNKIFNDKDLKELEDLEQEFQRLLKGENKPIKTQPKKWVDVEELNKQLELDMKKDKYINILKKKLIKLRQGKINLVDISLDKLIKYFGKKEGFKILINEMDKILFGKPVIIKAGNIFYTFNNKTKQDLKNIIEEGKIFYEEYGNASFSDVEIILVMQTIKKITLSIHDLVNVNKKQKGAFFKYSHNLDIDLKKYGIFKNNENIIYNDNCIITALKNGGLSDEKISNLRLECKNAEIPRNKLKNICEKYDICIKLTKFINNVVKCETIGNKEKQIINLGLIDEHYFINDITEYTSFSIENYNNIKNIKDWNKIYKIQDGKYKKSNTRFIDSFKLIKFLFINKEKYLNKLSNENSNIALTQYYNKVDNIIDNLNYDMTIGKNYKKVENIKQKETKDKYTNVFFDFETYTDKNKIHVPYLCCYISDDGNKGSFFGVDCAKQLLNDLEKKYKNICLIAHNVSYDYRFLLDNTLIKNEINKGTKLFSADCSFKKMNIKIKDSYLLISMPLRNFGKTFNLKVEKEIMPYDLYNKTNAVSDRFIKINDALKYVKENEKKQFIENIEKWELKIDDKFDCIRYSEIYCSMDCDVLKQGYNKFKEWMVDLVKLDIDNILTIASLAHKYFINDGCYNDVYELSGIPQQFIQKCVVGGRTMCNDNEKIQINKIVQDFDAVSLYPSAMYRMDGFLKGIPKIIKNLNYDDIKNYDGYFVEIKIKKVGINRNFPLMSYINNEGVRMFSNDMENKTIYVDKISLEDMINFQKIEFDIIKGYYFDNGFNTKIKETIKYIFDERKRMKKEKNPAEIVYKLIMNSGYGKSIMKPVETDTKIFNDLKQFNIFLSNNYTWVKEFTKLKNSEKVRVKIIKPINEHFNIAHVGVSILSMSKRIMNEVMTTAEDNNLKIYYQDTDSMHIDENNINILEKQFKLKYNRELIGKEMGQFHSDFDLDGCADIKATKSIFLGKKSYIDELEGIDKNGNIKKGFHIRMKGIPNSCIDYTYKLYNYKSPFEMYEDLFKGKEIMFDLTEGDNKSNFKFNKDGSVTTLVEGMFCRTLKF